MLFFFGSNAHYGRTHLVSDMAVHLSLMKVLESLQGVCSGAIGLARLQTKEGERYGC